MVRRGEIITIIDDDPVVPCRLYANDFHEVIYNADELVFA